MDGLSGLSRPSETCVVKIFPCRAGRTLGVIVMRPRPNQCLCSVQGHWDVWLLQESEEANLYMSARAKEKMRPPVPRFTSEAREIPKWR